MKKQLKQAVGWLKLDHANTAEENTNRGMWWVIGIIAVAIIAGIVFYVVGHTLSQAQSGATTLSTSASTQAGLDDLAKKAESGNVMGGTSSVGNSNYTGP